MSSAREWIENLPIVTKYFVLLSAVIPVAMKLGLIPVSVLVWHFESITKRYEVISHLIYMHVVHCLIFRIVLIFKMWRMFTSFFVTRTSLNFLFSLFFRFQYCYQLETIHFHQKSSDFFFFMFVCAILLNVPLLFLFAYLFI